MEGTKRKGIEGEKARSLRMLIATLESLRRITDKGSLTLPQILTLLTIGMRGEMPQSDIEGVVQSSGATVSRILWTQLGPDGLNLVSMHVDPLNRRRRIVTLTPRGQSAIHTMLDVIAKFNHGSAAAATA